MDYRFVETSNALDLFDKKLFIETFVLSQGTFALFETFECFRFIRLRDILGDFRVFQGTIALSETFECFCFIDKGERLHSKYILLDR